MTDSNCSVVLDVSGYTVDSMHMFRRPAFTVRIIRATPNDIRKSMTEQSWFYELSPGFGSFADSAARAVEKAESEEEACMLMSISGFPPDFIFRFKNSRLCSVLDTSENKTLWEAPPENLDC